MIAAPEVSVIICTHNPRAEYLHRVIDALHAQTLPFDLWELLLIDNVSSEPVADRSDLSWHPNARHIREEELGLTPARLRGIAEAIGNLLIFIDDDNVLSSDYLAEALAIAQSYPWLGAWGGTISGEFEVPPAEWAKPLLCLLAIRHYDDEFWSNDPGNGRALPVGAGLCIRLTVARKYREAVLLDPARSRLGRRGTSLYSTEDIDLIVTCRELGLGWGNFPRLRMMHLIPASRLSKRYFLRLSEDMAASGAIFRESRGYGSERPAIGALRLLRFVNQFVQHGRHVAQFYLAAQRGLRNAHRILSERPGSFH